MLANTVETVKRARELGATIVYAPITFTDDYHELSPSPYGILKGVVDSKSFRQGSWGAEIVDVLKPEPGDIVVEGKRGLCGFATTNLDFILRSRGISTIALGGFLTNCCVESTMRTGYEKGYDVVTLKDCTAALSEEEQRLAVEKNYPMFSRPMTHEEFLSRLKGGETSRRSRAATKPPEPSARGESSVGGPSFGAGLALRHSPAPRASPRLIVQRYERGLRSPCVGAIGSKVLRAGRSCHGDRSEQSVQLRLSAWSKLLGRGANCWRRGAQPTTHGATHSWSSISAACTTRRITSF